MSGTLSPRSFMKLAALVLPLGLLSAFGAVTGPVRLGSSQYADTEVSTNVAFAAWAERMFAFAYELDFNGTPSNNVQVAFGTGHGSYSGDA